MGNTNRRTRPVHIVGRKNSGKTTLICELIRELSAQGYRVGTIKHTSHLHELDTPGKDSQQHRAEGAVVAGIVSPNLCAAFWPASDGPTDPDRYGRLLRLYDDCDLVLVEGDTLTSAPKIEVWRSITNGIPFANSGLVVQGVVTDEPLECHAPVWPRSDVHGLVHRMLALAGAKATASPSLNPLATSQWESIESSELICKNEL